MAALAALAIATAGCSFMFVERPHESLPDDGASECTTLIALPVLDLMLGGAGGVWALYAGEKSGSHGAEVALGLTAGAVFAISAITGFYNTSRCSDLQSEVEEPARPRPRRRAPVVSPPPAPAAGPAAPE